MTAPKVPVVRPANLAEALEALRNATPATRLLAGGTDLMVELETGRTTPDVVIDLWPLDELAFVRDQDGGLCIGALTTCTALATDPLVAERADILAQAAWLVGASQIRNRATLGGNLGTASPAADLNPVLLALGARVRLRSATGHRDVDAADFLTGYRTTLRRPDELIESIVIPARPPGEHRAFRKVGTRRAQSIAKVVVATALDVAGDTIRTARAAAGSVADRTLLLPEITALEGHPADPAALDAAARRAAAARTPIDDVRSTARYRRQVLYRTLRTLLHRRQAPGR